MDTIRQGSQIGRIRFPEFTANLITGVFDAITVNQIKQMEAYSEMLNKTSKTLTEFVNETKDDITSSELLEFLSNTFSYSNNSGKLESIQYREAYDIIKDKNKSLSKEQKSKLEENLIVKNENDKIVGPEDITKAPLFLEAIRFRIAENKYRLLRDMMKLGFQKLIVNDGEIQTRLEFTATQNNSERASEFTSKREKSHFGAGFGNGFISFISGIRGGTSKTSIHVNTINTSKVDTSYSRIDIFGGVRLSFKSDYFPLVNFE